MCLHKDAVSNDVEVGVQCTLNVRDVNWSYVLYRHNSYRYANIAGIFQATDR